MCDIGGIKEADVSKRKEENRNQNLPQLNPMEKETVKENYRYVVITYMWVKFIYVKEAHKSTCELINGIKNIARTLVEKNVIIYFLVGINAEISSRWNALGNVKKETSIC